MHASWRSEKNPVLVDSFRAVVWSSVGGGRPQWAHPRSGLWRPSPHSRQELSAPLLLKSGTVSFIVAVSSGVFAVLPGPGQQTPSPPGMNPTAVASSANLTNAAGLCEGARGWF